MDKYQTPRKKKRYDEQSGLKVIAEAKLHQV